jgi:Recombinase zinc beta ribbon domain/Avirulence protein
VRDKYPAYITWDVFEKIQTTLKDNYSEYKKNKTRGIARKGQTLLQGILYCGSCGHKMTVKYKNKTHYLCEYLKNQYGSSLCQFIPQSHVDKVVVEEFFQVLSPIELNAYEEIRKDQRKQLDQIAKSRSLQLERLHYQVKLAEHQFNQVDPSNRLVAAELERRWEYALRDLKVDRILPNDASNEDKYPGQGLYKHLRRLYTIALLTSDPQVREEARCRLEWWYSNIMPFARGSAAVSEGLSKLPLLANNICPMQMKGHILPDLGAICQYGEEDFIKFYNEFYNDHQNKLAFVPAQEKVVQQTATFTNE